MNHQEKEKILNSLRNWAQWLDTRFTGPFGIKFGLDPLIGLVPILGDLFTLFISAFIFVQSIQLGLPFIIHLRMLLNILIDQSIKLIPFLGLFLDFAWKSNTRNITLIEKYISAPQRTEVISWGLISSIFLFMIMASVIVIYAALWVTLWLVQNITYLLGH